MFKYKNLTSAIYPRFRNLSSSSKCVSGTETLEPIQMSYATYESTSNQDHQDYPFVIMHGLFGSKSNWNSLCKVYNQKCKPSRKIIAVDARNHGESPHTASHTYAHMAADIKNLLENLSVEKAALMGHSMGGRVAMLFALKYPELVDRLIVADISPIGNSPNLGKMTGIFRTLERVKLPSNVPMSMCRAMVDKDLSTDISDKGLRAFLLTNLVENNKGIFQWRINIPILLANFNHIVKFPLLDDNLEYTGPTLFVAGANSDFVQ